MDTMKSDMKLLLESLKCSDLDTEQQIEALKTMAAICSSDQEGICIRKLGGLEIIANMFRNTHSKIIKQWLLYVLSSTVHHSQLNKRKICTIEIMRAVKELLSCKEPSSLAIFASNFLLSLCSNFAIAQEIARTSGCIDNLMSIYKLTIPKADEWFDAPDKLSKNLWTAVSSALCSMMGDPRNDANKLLCVRLLPQAISVLKNTTKEIVCSSLNFISHIVTSNDSTQRMLKIIGGLHALVNLLKRRMESNDDNDLTSLTLQTISCGITDHEINKSVLGTLDIVPLLLDLMKNDGLSDVLRTSCLVCLSRCIDDCSGNVQALYHHKGIPILVSTIIGTPNEEARKIAILILQNCKVSLKDQCIMMPPGKVPTDVHGKVDQSPGSGQKRRGGEEIDQHNMLIKTNSDQSSINHQRSTDMPLSIQETSNNQTEKNEAILSVLLTQSKILASVTKQVNEMRVSLSAHSEAGSLSSLPTSNNVRMSRGSSLKSPYTNAHGNSSIKAYSARVELKSSPCRKFIMAQRKAQTVTRSSSTSVSSATSKQRGRRNLSKVAIMNAYKKSRRSNLFEASKLGNTRDVGDASDKRIDKKESEKTNDTQPVGRNHDTRKGSNCDFHSMLSSENSPKASVSKEKEKAGCKPHSFEIVESTTLEEEMEEEGLENEEKNENVSIRRMNKKGRPSKEKLKALPSVFGGVPMLEQSSNEKVQDWIERSVPVSQCSEDGCIYESEEVVKRTKDEAVDRVVDTAADVSGIDFLSDIDDEVPGCDDRGMKESTSRHVANGSPPQSDAHTRAELLKGNVSSTPTNIRSTGSQKNSSYGEKFNDSKTPTNALPTRIANAGYKPRRSLRFNKETDKEHQDNGKCSPDHSVSDNDADDVSEIFPLCKPNGAEMSQPELADCHDHETPEDSNTIKDYDSEDCSFWINRDEMKERGKTVEYSKSPKCLGCYPFGRFPFFVLNRRNCVVALQKDKYTCSFHKKLISKGREKGRDCTSVEIRNVDQSEPKIIRALPNRTDSKSCRSSAVSKPTSRIMNEHQSTSGPRKFDGQCPSEVTSRSRKRKRKRQEYEEFEIENIYRGVRRYGRRWTAIINTYPFKYGRTAEDLKDKFRGLCRSNGSTGTSVSSARRNHATMPFTSQEIVNLKTGYGRYGARWKTILKHFDFQKGRTASDLEQRYSRLVQIIS